MCTLVAAVGLFADAPLVVAANRDERLDRPALPPFLWPGPPRFVSPRDEPSRGSWLGLNEHGLFVAVTNRAGFPPDVTRRSRGALVVETLAARSLDEARRRIADVDPAAFNAFHLLVAARAGAHLVASDGEVLVQQDLQPGLHVITERGSPLAPEAASLREARIRAAWTALPPGPPDLEALEGLLALHDESPLDGVCVHADAFGYGTRSAMVLRLGASASEATLRWAEGKPCQVGFVELGGLLGELGA